MSREYGYFVAGALVVLVPLLLLFFIKKLDLMEVRPDTKLAFTSVNGTVLNLHVFRAHAATTATPALLLFHGGGWRYGSPRQFYPQCRYFVERGYTCFSAEYRLGPTHAPDIAGAIQDAAAALDYLRDNSSTLGIDADRIAVGGGSSGGHLAAALGAGLHGADRAKPAALVLYNPVLDLAPCSAAHYLAGDDWRAVSPQQHVTSDYPRTLVLSGGDDSEIPVAMVQDFCAAVTAADGSCELAIYAGQHHGFFNDFEGKNPYFDKTNERALQFLQQL